MSTQTHPTPDQIIAARRARQAAEARNAELSLAAWEHECAERAQQNLTLSRSEIEALFVEVKS